MGEDAIEALWVLKWVYGHTVSQEAEQYAERLRDLLGQRDRDAVMLDWYEDVAHAFRQHYEITMSRQRVLALKYAATPQQRPLPDFL